MIDEPTIGVRFLVDVVDCVQRVVEAFVYSDSVTFGFAAAVVSY